MKPPTDDAVRWLLDSDPAIRWQTLRDLAGAPADAVERERRKVARDGWGARLLARQGREGAWAPRGSSDGGLYLPKWTSTTYTMLLLRDLGLPAANPQARKACALLLDQGLRRDGGISYGTWAKWTGRGETCMTGMVLSILSYFGYDDDRLDRIAQHLLEEQMPDGGWNCRRPSGATHSSVHTTISVLEGLRLYELHRQGRARSAGLATSGLPRRSVSSPAAGRTAAGRSNMRGEGRATSVSNVSASRADGTRCARCAC